MTISNKFKMDVLKTRCKNVLAVSTEVLVLLLIMERGFELFQHSRNSPTAQVLHQLNWSLRWHGIFMLSVGISHMLSLRLNIWRVRGICIFCEATFIAFSWFAMIMSPQTDHYIGILTLPLLFTYSLFNLIVIWRHESWPK